MTHGKATSPRTQESCQDGAKDEGWDQKDKSRSNTHPPQGGERFAGVARGGRWDGAMPSWPPMVCLPGLPEAISLSQGSAPTFTF